MKWQMRKQNQENRKRFREHKFEVEDERGWAGQHGQRPANDEERDYRPNRRGNAEVLDND